ncbi:PAS domain-containing sensor histidine kinase [Roseobacter ponti]|uniref:histidine kinase n=1 Tax=Roseobacter ponti TaxID=1891787 RepID=A0A858SX05_9RHOB|nr:PAS domain-containing sensor histidine kinase [Roseobacter ponti]QJF52362.1 PAS domain S-box protein [Roseobacter ponti]
MHSDPHDSAILDTLLMAAPDAIVICDQTGKILRASAAAHSTFGYEPGELTGRNVRILMPETLGTLHDGYIARHIATGEVRILDAMRDVEGRRKDGSSVPLQITLGGIDAGGAQHFTAVMHDLTRRRATQNALSRSQRMDAIGQMTGGIAHDFNNILTLLIGNLELLELRGLTDRQAGPVADALHAAQLGADLTQRLMAFARRSDLRPVMTDLRAPCGETLRILKGSLGENYTVRTDFAEDADMVMIDPVQFQSALTNLVFNARDAMGASGDLLISLSNVTIDDTYVAQETGIRYGRYVRLSVGDNGAGMDEEAQKRAFEPFFTTKSDAGGTGLGLATVYGFVRQSGGHVTLYSEPGLGSNFGLYFPAVHSDAETVEKTGARATDTPVRIADSQMVLVVEDNPRVRKLSVERIRDLGFSVEEAASGDSAYLMLKEGLPVDIVFSDLVMPGRLSGYDLAAKIADEFPQIRVLLTSGYASDVVTSRMAQGQVFDILHKPYRQAELARRLQVLLDPPAGG